VQPAPATTSENSVPEPVIGSLETQDDVLAFQELNEEWINRFFTMEPADRATLDDPFGRIVAAGGDILIARVGTASVGCVALVPTGNGVYELSKMAVAPEAQGRGIGRKLLVAAIERARELGATSLFLGSNTKLASAVHLYESVGFTHVPPEQIAPMPYERADVFMELVL
jgi:putative acetyltransferase